MRIEVDEHYCITFHEPSDESGNIITTVCLKPNQMLELFTKINDEFNYVSYPA